MSALRAIRDLTEQAKQAHLDAAERCMAFDIYAAWAARYPADTVLEWARQRIDITAADGRRIAVYLTAEQVAQLAGMGAK